MREVKAGDVPVNGSEPCGARRPGGSTSLAAGAGGLLVLPPGKPTRDGKLLFPATAASRRGQERRRQRGPGRGQQRTAAGRGGRSVPAPPGSVFGRAGSGGVRGDGAPSSGAAFVPLPVVWNKT